MKADIIIGIILMLLWVFIIGANIYASELDMLTIGLGAFILSTNGLKLAFNYKTFIENIYTDQNEATKQRLLGKSCDSCIFFNDGEPVCRALNSFKVKEKVCKKYQISFESWSKQIGLKK